MPTSRQQLEACLTKLRAAGLVPPKAAATAEGFQLHVAVLVEKLGRFDARAVTSAFDRWIEEQAEWPTINRLLALVREKEQLLHPARSPSRADNAVAFRPRKPEATPDDIRETCKWVEEVRGSPEKFLASPTVLAIGEFLIARHIACGRAPPDVVGFYGHLPDKYPAAVEQALAVAAE